MKNKIEIAEKRYSEMEARKAEFFKTICRNGQQT